MSDTGDSIASAAGRPDDVQEEEIWLFNLFNHEEGFIKNHCLPNAEEKEKILHKILERLRQG